MVPAVEQNKLASEIARQRLRINRWLESRNDEPVKETSFVDHQNIVRINMSQAKNIDQAEQIDQTVGSIVLSRAATTKVEKTKDLRIRMAGVGKGSDNSRTTSQNPLRNSRRRIDKGSDEISKQLPIKKKKNIGDQIHLTFGLDVRFFSTTADAQATRLPTQSPKHFRLARQNKFKR